MDADAGKLEQAVLALLHMDTCCENSGKRASKAVPWSAMDQLHSRGYIPDPATKNKSVWGQMRSQSCQKSGSRSFWWSNSGSR